MATGAAPQSKPVALLIGLMPHSNFDGQFHRERIARKRCNTLMARHAPADAKGVGEAPDARDVAAVAAEAHYPASHYPCRSTERRICSFFRAVESEVLGASLEGGSSKSSRSRLAKFLTFSAPPRQIPVSDSQPRPTVMKL